VLNARLHHFQNVHHFGIWPFQEPSTSGLLPNHLEITRFSGNVGAEMALTENRVPLYPVKLPIIIMFPIKTKKQT
jgi:hypothetical protein